MQSAEAALTILVILQKTDLLFINLSRPIQNSLPSRRRQEGSQRLPQPGTQNHFSTNVQQNRAQTIPCGNDPLKGIMLRPTELVNFSLRQSNDDQVGVEAAFYQSLSERTPIDLPRSMIERY
jgi:hypothetical protein